VLASAAAADDRAELLAEAAALRQDAAALDDAWLRMTGWLKAPGETVEALDLTLKKAVVGKDLQVRLYRVGKTVVRGMAWAPDWNSEVHTVDSGDLAVDDNGGKARISGKLHVRLAYDGSVPLEGTDFDAWFTLDGILAGGKLTGQFSSVVPEGKKADIPTVSGQLTGVQVTSAAALQRPAGIPQPKLDQWGGDAIIQMGNRLSQLAEDTYQGVRAIVIAAANGLPYADAWKQVVPVQPWFKDAPPTKDAPSPKKGKKKEKNPSLDDLEMGGKGKDDLGGVLDVLSDIGAKDAPITPRMLDDLKAMRKRVGTLLQWVTAREKAGRDPSTFKHPTAQDPGDPLFHPWYQTVQPLELEGNVHVLPRDAGGPGRQHWAPIRQWNVIGPFPVEDWRAFSQTSEYGNPGPAIPWTSLTPGLPAVVADVSTRFRADPFPGPGGASRYKGPEILQWTATAAYDEFGGVAPPYQAKRNPHYGQNRFPPGYSKGHAGMDFGAYLAEAEVKAAADVVLWAAVGLQARGMLWVNDQLIWAGPDDWRKHWLIDGGRSPTDHRAESVALVKLPLKQGVNRLRIRCEVGYASQFWWMRLCTRGAPGDKAASEALLQRAAEATAKLPPAIQGFGLRGDATGIFDAQPPVAWNLKERQNIAWYRALPYWSNASPVLAGDRVFVMVEPDRLYCLSKSDGSILWERTCNAISTLPEAERARGQALYDAWWSLRQKRDAIPAVVLKPDNWLERSLTYYWNDTGGSGPEEDERAGASPELLALLDKRDALLSSPNVEEIQGELNAVLTGIDKARKVARASDPSVIAAHETVKELGQAWGSLIKFLSEKFGVSGPEGYWSDLDGYQFATPVTDGKRIWVKTGFGALACFDMDGNEVYRVAHRGLGSGSATIPSPLLIDGTIVMPLRRLNPESRQGTWQVVAFDAQTGKELWAVPTTVVAWGACSPTALRLSNGTESMPVIITATGHMLRVEDGHTLAAAMQLMNDCGSIATQGGQVAFTGTTPMTVVRPVMIDRDTVGFKPLWRRGDSAQYGSAGLADGLVYTDHGRGGVRFRGGPSEGWGSMRRFRVADGIEIGDVPLMRKGGNFWSIPTISREYIYFYGGDTMFAQVGNKQPMSMAVVERGAEGDLVAVNAVERSYSAAVMEGDRLYMRGYQGIWCVAYTGDEGRAYEARHVAETLLDQVAARRPRPTTAAPKATTSLEQRSAHQRTKLDSGLAPASWHHAGPFPAGSLPPIRDECRDASRWINRGASAAGTGWKLVAFSPKHFPNSKATKSVVDMETFTLVNRQRQRVVDLALAMKLEPGTVHYLYAELENERDRVMMFTLGLAGAKAWVNGVALADGDRCQLPRGSVTLLVEITVDALATKETVTLAPCFWDADDPGASEKAWVDFVTRHRGQLQRAVDLAPDSVEGRRAKSVLEQL
jgi:hypothetical protein